jgi:hypothetical protein
VRRGLCARSDWLVPQRTSTNRNLKGTFLGIARGGNRYRRTENQESTRRVPHHCCAVISAGFLGIPGSLSSRRARALLSDGGEGIRQRWPGPAGLYRQSGVARGGRDGHAVELRGGLEEHPARRCGTLSNSRTRWRSGSAHSAGEDLLEVVGCVPTKSTSHCAQQIQIYRASRAAIG